MRQEQGAVARHLAAEPVTEALVAQLAEAHAAPAARAEADDDELVARIGRLAEREAHGAEVSGGRARSAEASGGQARSGVGGGREGGRPRLVDREAHRARGRDVGDHEGRGLLEQLRR